jgi:S1-C subfamily serine protease
MRTGQREPTFVAIDGTETRGIQDMMFVLRRARPGDTTTATVVRDGDRVELQVTYGASAGRPRGN